MVPLCDSSGGNCCDGSSLCAGFSGNSSGGRGRGRLSSLSRLVARALPRDVTGLRALVTDLAGRAQRATVGSGAITRDVTLGACQKRSMDRHTINSILTSFPQA